MVIDSSFIHCCKKADAISVNKTGQKTAKTCHKSGYVINFFKWAVNKPQNFLAAALGLSALGAGTISCGITLLGGATMASRSVRSAGSAAFPFAQATATDSPLETTGIDDSFTDTFTDITVNSDESPFTLITETTAPWLEAAVSEWLSDSVKSAEGDRSGTGFNGEIRHISQCNSYKPGFQDGRVELFVNGTWGTVCNDYFDNADAAVVCRMMDLPSEAAMALPEGSCLSGMGPILLTDLACNGDESSLLDCEHGKLPKIDCDHSEDVAVRCSKKVRFSPQSKLSDGNSGKIQIWNRDKRLWSYIKRDNFTSVEAEMFCQEMGFGKAGAHITTASRDVREDCPTDCSVIQGIHCTGSEASLLDCQGSLMAEACNRPCEVVSVGCRHWIRLNLVERSYSDKRDEPGSVIGRVEAFYNNSWQAVSSAGLDTSAAQVACRDLGYPLEASPASLAVDRDDVPILINKVHCSGNENNFLECEYELRQPAEKSPENRVAGVCCQSKVRIAADDCRRDSGNTVSGRVEAWYNGLWHGVCGENLENTNATARVVCQEQGYPPDGAALTEGSGNSCNAGRYSSVLANVSCSGSEVSLLGCNLQQVSSPAPCEPMAVSCSKKIHLVASNCPDIPGFVSGELEIWEKGSWIPFCFNGLYYSSRAFAEVACRELGHHERWAEALDRSCRRRSGFSGVINSGILDDTCYWYSNCSYKRIKDYGKAWVQYNNNCSGGLLTIKCALISEPTVPPTRPAVPPTVLPPSTTIRLSSDCTIPETGPVRGRVELFQNGQWGTVCGDDFNQDDAEVVCHALGFAKNGSVVLPPGTCPAGTGPILLNHLQGSWNKTDLRQVDNHEIGVKSCTHDRDAAVLCSHQIRLVPDCKTRKLSDVEGRVELFVNGAWGTVCNKYFSTVNAKVVCRLLGLPADGAMALSENTCLGGSGPIHLDHVTCLGNETSLLECSNNGVGVHDCTHSEDVAVRCGKPARFDPDCNTSSRSGRIQLWYKGAWTNVYDKHFDGVKADKFCQELGLPEADSYALTSNPDDCPATNASPHRLLEGIHCSEGAMSLLDCINKERPTVQSCEPPCELISVSCRPGVRLDRAKRTYVAEEDQPGTVAGRVEVFLDNRWTTIKSGGVDEMAAGVVCRELGHPVAGSIVLPAPSRTPFWDHWAEHWKWNSYYPATDSILMKHLTCNGTETRFSNCYSGLNRPHENSTDWGVAVIRCQSRVRFAPEYPQTDTGATVNGRPEIWYQGAWHATGSKHINDHAARVACSEMGYPMEGSIKTAPYAPGSAQTNTLGLVDVNCSGQESDLMDCNLQSVVREFKINNTFDPVSLQCNKRIRLQRFGCQASPNGTVTGKPEVLVLGKWQGICRTELSSSEAGVICSELGYAREGAKVLPYRTCPIGTLTRDRPWSNGHCELVIKLDCQGHEAQIKECDINLLKYQVYHKFYFSCTEGNQVSINCLEATPATGATPATPATPSIVASPTVQCSQALYDRENNTSGQGDNICNVLIGGISAIGLAGTAFATCLMLNARKLKSSNKNMTVCQSLRKALTIKNPFYFLRTTRIHDLQAVQKRQYQEFPRPIVPMGKTIDAHNYCQDHRSIAWGDTVSI